MRGAPSLGARAHSYSHGDFFTWTGDGGDSGGLLQRHRSALPHCAEHRTVLPCSELGVPLSVLALPHTPPLLPLDSENDIAHTILMLATPPAAHAPSLS
ncbi:hypothetical protein LPJ61_003231, partial [Coemansia biformis]